MRLAVAALALVFASGAPAQAQQPTYRTRADYPACLTLSAYRELQNFAASGDRAAFARYLADQRHGCIILRGGLEVYRERAAFGIIKIRLRGETVWLYAATEAVQ